MLAPFYTNFRKRASNVALAVNGGYGNPMAGASSNNMGSYIRYITALAFDAYFLQICFNDGAASGQNKQGLADVAIDRAGGTDFTEIIIPYLSYFGASAQAIRGINYGFPIFIPAGASVGLRTQMNSGTGGPRVWVQAYGAPEHPEMCKVGTYVDVYGAVPATSTGTAITPGNAAEGAWTQLSAGIPRPVWWWQVALCSTNNVRNNRGYLLSLSADDDTTTPDFLLQNSKWQDTSTEAVSHEMDVLCCINDVPAGSPVYGRAKCGAAPDTSMQMIAYGLGG